MNTANFLSIPASMFGDQEVLVYGDVRLTYADALSRVRRLASALARRGVGRGKSVAVLATNSHRYVECYYATATAGATFVPLNYRAKLPELEHMIVKASPAVLFYGARYAPLLEQLGDKLPRDLVRVPIDDGDGETVETWIADAPEEMEDAEVEESDTSVLMYTSGTTSLPKGVMLSFGDFTAYVVGTVEMADGEPRGAALLCVPLYHIAGATNIMTSLWTGRKLVLLPQFDAGEWLEAVEREGVTHAFVVPTMLKQILDHPRFASTSLSSLTNLSYGGAPMPFPVIRRALESFPATCGFVNAFGQTETTSTLTVLGPDDHRLTGDAAGDEVVLRRLHSIGRPLPDVEIKVVDESGDELPANQTGEILVRTPRVMKGYAGDVEGGARLEPDGFLHTRDLGYVDDDGYVFLVGRQDDMIIRGGENIAPAEVESILQGHTAVEEVAVLGLPSVEWGQIVAAVVVLRPGATATTEEISEYCRARLASFKKPEVIRVVDELPRNPLGKILRKELREQLGQG
ncbi:MAG: long-chain fatty acid--CoA ligase [Deltaproteobacteria bacterium]|nr:long-chain fatty acid--CoA ligase [Deltaproteobacteria bacterium]